MKHSLYFYSRRIKLVKFEIYALTKPLHLILYLQYNCQTEDITMEIIRVVSRRWSMLKSASHSVMGLRFHATKTLLGLSAEALVECDPTLCKPNNLYRDRLSNKNNINPMSNTNGPNLLLLRP